MSRKLAILFAVLAITSIANGAASTGSASPSSAYSVAVGNVFTNATDTTFTNIQSDCYFTAGFDNTTNYVWCETQSTTSATVGSENSALPWPQSGQSATYNSLVLQRRAINASSPSTKNATLDTKITTSIQANDGGMFCSGVGYLGIAYGFGSGTSTLTLTSEIYLSYIAVNGTTVTTVKIAANTDNTIRSTALACTFDKGIFYVVYSQYTADTSAATPYAKNKILIQGVNVTSGTVYYNTTGGVSLLTPTSASIVGGTGILVTGLIPTNWTNYGSTLALLTYGDSMSGTSTGTSPNLVTTTTIYKVLPITLATGAPGTVVTLGTSGTSTLSTEPATTGTTTTTVQTVSTTYSIAGGFGSLSTYGVVLTKDVSTTITLTGGATSGPTTTHVYSSTIFLNGSSTASTTFNLTNPTGFHLSALTGYSTNAGFGLISVYNPDSSTATSYQINLDTYYANGTSIVSATSLGTFDNGLTSLSPTEVDLWIDAAGSPWLGYVTQNTGAAWTDLDLIAGYAGEIAVNILSANTLSSVFTFLTLLIAALFAF